MDRTNEVKVGTKQMPTQRLTITLPVALLEQLDQYRARQSVAWTKSFVLQVALDEYLRNQLKGD